MKIKQIFCSHDWQDEFFHYPVLPAGELKPIAWYKCTKCSKEKVDWELEGDRVRANMSILMETWKTAYSPEEYEKIKAKAAFHL